MSSISDLLQVLGSSTSQILIAVTLSLVGYIARGMWDEHRLVTQRKRIAVEAATLAATEASTMVKTANIADQTVLRNELWTRIESLEAKSAQRDREMGAQIQQRDADHVAELVSREAAHASERAAEAQRHLQQLATLTEGHAECLKRVAELTQESRSWRDQAEAVIERFASAAVASAAVFRPPSAKPAHRGSAKGKVVAS